MIVIPLTASNAASILFNLLLCPSILWTLLNCGEPAPSLSFAGVLDSIFLF